MNAPAPRGREAGITLVEMLVALALFALVGLASFSVLDTVIRTRDRTEGRLEEVAALDRAMILWSRDLGQSDPGSLVLDAGGLRFGLAGAGGPEAMAYALEDGALERRTGEDGAVSAQRLVPEVDTAAFRALDRDGAWHEAWPPEAAAEELPPPLVGVEMRLTLATGGTLRRLAELPLGVPP